MTDALIDPGTRCDSCEREGVKTLFSEPHCANFCFRCWDREAPYGYNVCRECGYERAAGLPCGWPCV